ncbi:MAG: glycosyltransferase family 1 protein [Rhodospirillaceae bacterium]|nr:MAG: glycosyltransferase family 1 protein [Rhodospirillaceae bacterium]
MNSLPRVVVPPRWNTVKGTVPRLLHVFPGFGLGGSQRRFAAIANHFGSAFQHLIWSLDGNCDARGLLVDNGAWNFELNGFPRRNMLNNIVAARGILRRLAPDVLVTYNWGAIEWAAANLFPLTRHFHIEDGFGPEEADRQIPRRAWFRRLILNRHSKVILPSRNLVRIATEIWRLDPARVVYVPNGINCGRFADPADPTQRGAFRGSGLVIGTVATLRREKALGRLIEAFAVARAQHVCRLVIVGDGPERSVLEGMAANLGLSEHITFTGSLDRPERILGAFDLFAVSSDTEQMPLSILEAMAAGLPIASTAAGDIADMVAEENRPFVVEKTTAALAEAMADLLGNTGLRTRLANANRAKAITTFDESVMFKTYGQLFSGSAGKSDG